jgi:uncharacterized flavoprotein (TIGR03862 family)
MTIATKPAAVIGAGPAGLMAAEVLSAAGTQVTVYDRMALPGRKFLMAGRGGLNLTHNELFAAFVARYGEAADWIEPMLAAFGPAELRAWADGLQAETFVGTSGRVFPKAMKAAPLLRAWLKRLKAQQVAFCPRHDWRGWNDAGDLVFSADGEMQTVSAGVTLIALGGASWPRLGSTGAWAEILRAKGIAVASFKPANCGFLTPWSERMRAFAGEPLKGIALSFAGRTVRGEATVTAAGLEGGGIYALSRDLREAISAKGSAVLSIDLKPAMTAAEIAAKLKAARPGQSLANTLRKTLHLAPVAINLMREGLGVHLPKEPEALAAAVKSVPVRLTSPAPIARAISSAGGIRLAELDETLQLKKLPGVFAAGEMLDWEAPTGGYLMTACLSTGVAAAKGMLATAGTKREKEF